MSRIDGNQPWPKPEKSARVWATTRRIHDPRWERYAPRRTLLSSGSPRDRSGASYVCAARFPAGGDLVSSENGDDRRPSAPAWATVPTTAWQRVPVREEELDENGHPTGR